MNLDRRLLKQIHIVRFFLAVTVLAGLLAGLATVVQARQVSRIISGVFLNGLSLPAVMPWMAALLAVIAARALLGYIAERAAVLAALRVKEHLRQLLTRHLLALGPSYAQGERSGELVNTATQGIEALDAYFSQFLPQLALAGLLPLAYLIIVFPVDPLSALVLLLTGPLIPFFMFLIGSTAERLTRRQWTALGRMSAYFLDTLQGLVTLKTLGRSRDQTTRIAEVGEQYRQTTMSVLRVTFLSALVLELLSTLGTAIIAVEIGLRLLYGRMDFEAAFFLLLLAPEFYLPLRALGLRFHASMSGVSAARRIFEVMEQPLPVPDQPKSPAAAVPSLSRPFVIQLRDVSFAYPGRDLPAVDRVTLTIPSGQTLALVGASGSGKSTLAQLLLGFLQPAGGDLLVNGIPLSALAVEDWRAQVAWVPQQPYIFHGSLADNLRIARSNATPEEMRRAAQQAHLLEWIETLPQGLDTPVGEGGSLISGGQAQRLALARAFLRDAPLLVMDEPTAHLDVAQEHLLQESTRRLCQGRTVVVIAHRLATVSGVDQVAVMQAGRVLETGSPAGLLAQGGAYARLVFAYAGGSR